MQSRSRASTRFSVPSVKGPDEGYTPQTSKDFARFKIMIFALLMGLWALPAGATPLTMRLDYFHSGNAAEERFALDGAFFEGPWAGPEVCKTDDTNLGKYYFEVLDRKTNRVL